LIDSFYKSTDTVVKYLTYIPFLLTAFTAYGQGSVLSSGKWYKIAVEKHGVYRLSFEDLNKMGFDPASIDPTKIAIYGLEGAMLPQSNSVTRPGDLVQLSIAVEDGDDGKFDRSDGVLFYAEGPDRISFNIQGNVTHYEKNIYSDKNFYFVTVATYDGARIEDVDNGDDGNIIDQYRDFVYHESNEYNVLHSGREWFGESFELTPERVFDLPVSGVVNGSELKLISEVMAQSNNPSSFKLSLNGQPIGEQPVSTIPNSTYGVKGRMRRDTLVVNADNVGAPGATVQRLTYNFNRATSGRSGGYLNFFSLHFNRHLSFDGGDQIRFVNAQSINQQSRFEISSSNALRVWNITNVFAPVEQIITFNPGKGSFTIPESPVLQVFVAFGANVPSPELVGAIENQNLHGKTTPEMIIVTHPDFVEEANRLAAHRSAHNGISVEVVTTDQVYNEFSSGRQDVSAIRDFAKHLYAKNPTVLKSLLLFGKCSYDYKDRVRQNYNMVPTYESRNSLSPLETYSSDDYFAFLEHDEGEWAEAPIVQDHSMDIGVGRLPAKTVDEARGMVNKLIAYDLAPKRFGPWRKDIVFVADDGSNSDGFTSIHQSQANSLAEDVELLNPEFNTRKIFLGTYQKKVSPNGEAIPKANEDIQDEFNSAVIINYTGHGSEKLWADERVLTAEDVASLANKSFPFLVTATCEFGRHDDPEDISTAELSILRENAGSIGLVTTARPVNSSTNFALNQAFYDGLFLRDEGKRLNIGQVIRFTKNNSTSGVANRNFSLLGDPSITLALPSYNVVVDHIKTQDNSDTLKALSTVTVRGRVVTPSGETDPGFQGILHTTLFDKRTGFRTVGRNDPAFQFNQWYNPLFRGKASVVDGAFEFSFILPKNIAYQVNPGKLSVYAVDATRGLDASGASSSFKIGESEPDVADENHSPIVQAFLGDTTFVDGGTVSPDTRLIVKISDDSGINISNYGIGNTMMAILDDDQAVFLINDYYESETDDYTKGWVNFPIRQLTPGKHTLTVKVWDTHNNSAQHTIAFNVSSEGQLLVEAFGNYPNPFSGQTTVFFRHNRAGEDLQVQFTLLNSAGMELRTVEKIVTESTYEVDLWKINDVVDFGKKLPPGLYFGRLTLRSLSDGAESTSTTKLISAN
jgi:hypothetical protein